MSIVDVSLQQHNRGRPHRGRYYDRRVAAKAYEIYYIMAVTAAFAVLLLCTTGMLVFVSNHSRAPAKDVVCHDHHDQVPNSDLGPAEEPAVVQDESVPGASPELEMVVPQISPLQHILRRDLWEHPVSEDDELTQGRIQQRATVEESSLVIGETVVSYNNREELMQYVRGQAEASRIISKKQVDAILAMIRLNSTDLIFLHAKTGMFGSLRNSLTLALCTQKSDNIHFMLVILQVEAHLGWKFMARGERSSWNMAMKASLERKMRSETEKLSRLSHRESDSPTEDKGSHASLH